MGFHLGLALVAGGIALAQPSAPDARFEAASVKPVAREVSPYYFVMRGGPGTKTPTQFTCESAPLSKLLMRAYDVKVYQLEGPSWLDSVKYDIAAKLPPDTSEPEFRLMLQNLLAERFGAVVERKQKEMPVYELVVARTGPKLALSGQQRSIGSVEERVPAAPQDAAVSQPSRSKTRLDANGYPESPDLPDGRAVLLILNGKAKLVAKKESMELLVKRLEFHLGRPVVDLTGLKGEYAFTLFWVAGDAASGGPTVFEALRAQLGLELHPAKRTVETRVVRHMERIPTEN